MVTTEEQLKNKANFVDDNGNLYLVRCMACPGADERGTENWALAAARGYCAHCGWMQEKQTSKGEKEWNSGKL